MALKLRPTGLGSGIDKDRAGLHHLQWRLGHGAHHEQRGGPDSMRWFWSLHGIFGKPAECAPTAIPQRSTGPRRSSKSPGGNGWRGRSRLSAQPDCSRSYPAHCEAAG